MSAGRDAVFASRHPALTERRSWRRRAASAGGSSPAGDVLGSRRGRQFAAEGCRERFRRSVVELAPHGVGER